MITVKVDISDATKSLDEIQKGLPGALRRGVMKAAQIFEGAVRRTIYDTFKGRTGGLARSFRSALVYSEKTRAGAVVGSDSPYAEIQNDGGPIRPRTVRYLAIPVGKTRNKAIAPWPRDRSDLVLIKSKKGNLLLAKVSKKGKIDPQYVLKPSVELKGRRYLERALESSLAEISDKTKAEVSYIVSGEK